MRGLSGRDCTPPASRPADAQRSGRPATVDRRVVYNAAMRILSCRLRLALAALLVGLAVRVAADDAAPLPAQQLSGHAWMVQGGSAQGSRANDNFISNAGFVVTPAGVVVVDALGSPRLGRRLLATIASV